MLTVGEILKDGEKLLGDYNMEIARWVNGRWTSTVPSLYVVITDRRLVIQPYGRKHREPAIIPAAHIIYAKPFQQAPRHGLILSLKSDYRIALFIPAQNHTEILNHIRKIAMPTRRRQQQQARTHEIPLDLGGLQKLIDYFKRA